MEQASLQRKDGGLCAIPRAHFLEHSEAGIIQDVEKRAD
jgi:hypothetical protein